MKFIQKTKIIIILLIFVTLLFALLGSLNLYSFKEGLDDDTDTVSRVLTCPSGLIPANHDCVADLDEIDKDDLQYYALKTELVPPICPNCPYYADISYGSYHNSKDDSSTGGTGSTGNTVTGDKNNLSTNIDTKTTDVSIGNKTSVDQSVTDNSTSEYSNSQQDNSTTSQDNSVSQNTNTTTKQNVNQDNSQDNSQVNTQDNSTKQSADSKWNNLFGNNSINFGGGKNNSNIQSTGDNSQGTMAASGSGTGAAYGTGSGSGTGVNASPYAQSMGGSNSNPFMFQQGAYLQGPDLETTNMINSLKQKVDMLMKEKIPAITSSQFGNYPESSSNCNRTQNYRSSGNIPIPVLNDFSRF